MHVFNPAGWTSFDAETDITSAGTDEIFVQVVKVRDEDSRIYGWGQASAAPSIICTVTFDTNGGTRTGGGELVQNVAYGESVAAPILTREGYTFSGWDKPLTNITMTQTITAQWAANSTGGNGDEDNGSGSGGGSGRGGGSGSGSTVNSGNTVIIIVTPPAPDQPNAPTQAEITVPGTADSKGNVTVDITEQTITDAVNKVLEDARQKDNEEKGIIVVLRVDTGSQNVSSVNVNLPEPVQETIIANRVVTILIVVDNPDIKISMDLRAVEEVNRQAKADVNVSAARRNSSQLSKVHWLTSSVYDSEEKVLRFSTNHFSIYGVGYKEEVPAFTDIEKHWAKQDIGFVVRQGLFRGTSGTTFSPDMAMTRGMFVTVLGRMAKADASGYKESIFTDVRSDAYYTGYIEWARLNSIIKGTGNGMFAPDKSITREEMAVIIQNYATAHGFTLPEVNEERAFADSDKTSAYAKEAVQGIQMAGIISGKGGNLFDPRGEATRAEVSAVLRRFLELLISSGAQ